MNKTLRFSLGLTFVFFAAAAGCSGGESENKGLSNTPPPSSAGTTSTGPVVNVDGGDPDAYVEGPPVVEPDPDELDCRALQELGECGGDTLVAKLDPVNVLLVIDKSLSMEDKPEGFDVDKWEALETALGASLGGGDFDINYGLLLYPDTDIGGDCGGLPEGAAAINVPIETGTNSVRNVLLAIGETAPSGGTPTAAALARALEYFTEGDGAALDGNSYVLLATDGGPNCNPDHAACEAATCTSNMDGQCPIDNCCTGAVEICLDDAAVLEQITALKEAGIATFVIGIPGTEAYSSYLDSFATAGGVPNTGGDTQYFAVEAAGGVDALTDTFTTITSSLIRSCTVPLSEPPPNIDEVNVAVDCETVKRDTDWGFPNPDDPSTITLIGEICTQVETEGAQRIDVVYGCPSIR
jgi:hypothetical protein